MAAGAKVKVRTLLQDKPWTVALKDRTINSDAVEFDFDDIEEASDHFKPLVRDMIYDCGELAIVTYLQAKAYNKPLVLLPFVVSGAFHHKSCAYNTDSGEITPTTMAGKRFGVRTYSQTTGVWVRGVLQNEYGTDLSKVTWVTFDDAHLAEHTDPKNCVRAPAGKKLTPMLLAGELDGALMGGNMPDDPRLKTVIPNPQQAAKDWFAKYGVTPINHMFVVTRELLDTQPEAVRAIFNMLVESKKNTTPAFPSGLDGDWKALDFVSEYAFQQGVIPRKFSVEELFADVAPILGR